MALATARKAPVYEPHYTTDSAGNHAIDSYVLAKTNTASGGDVQLGQRLVISALLLVTILVHGAAAFSVGLGLSVATKWSGRVLAIMVGLATVVVFILQPANTLLALLVTRTSFNVPETLLDVAGWNIVVAFFAVALSCSTIRTLRRRISHVSQTNPLLASELNVGPPAIGAIFIGD